jgi:glucose/arabinose dehydrogenase
MLQLRTIAFGCLLVCAVTVGVHAQLRTRVQVSGFSNPVAFVFDPIDSAIQFVVQQDGQIKVVRNGTTLPGNLLDVRADVVSGGEQGLLGLAFPPDGAVSGRLFVNFTDRSGNTVVARFRRSADPLLVEGASRFDLRWGGAGGPAYIAQPFANHNGGHLAFGPDGFLYIGLGDGGSADDPGHRAQTLTELLGKMLRLDVAVPDADPIGYRIPPGNPFAGGGARPEIWALGLRNPWRYSFDDPLRGGTGALVIGDVGQGRWEEVDYEPTNRSGRNYGWRNREGAHDNVTSRPPATMPLVDPIHEYDHSTGQSITGGYVYRGSALGSAFQGRYFFADFIQGRVWSLGLIVDPATGEARAGNLMEHTAEMGGFSTLGNISSFGVDQRGELYLVGYSRGIILKIVGPAAAPAAPSGLRIIRASQVG